MIEVKPTEKIVAEIVDMTNRLYRRYLKSQKQSDWCEEVLSTYHVWQELSRELVDARELATFQQRDSDNEQPEDLEWKSIVNLEIVELETKVSKLQHQLNILLVDLYPYKYRDVLLEICADTGDGASILVEDLVQMYTRYAEDNKWKVELVSESADYLYGLSRAILKFRGAFVGCFFQFETGVHQVKRISKIELNSTKFDLATAMVTVMPVIDRDEVDIDPHDLELRTSTMYHPRITNTTGVNLYHKPTGIWVLSDRQRSQWHNKEKAFQILLSKLYTLNIQKQLGADERSHIIRTYDYESNCVTDLNSGMNFPLDRVLNGELDPLIASHAPNHSII